MNLQLQRLLFPSPDTSMAESLYFHRGNDSYFDVEEKEIVFQKDARVSFDTYFNGFSIGKWRKYTQLNELKLSILISGKFVVSTVNYELINGSIVGKVIGETIVESDEKTEVVLSFDGFHQKGMHTFILMAMEDNSIFYGGEYYTENVKECSLQNVTIALNMCTYMREKYILKNVNKIRSTLIENPKSPLNDKLYIYITDPMLATGNSLVEAIKLYADKGIPIDNIKVIENRNYRETTNLVENLINRTSKKKLISVHSNYEDEFRKIESYGTKNYANNLFDTLGCVKSGKLSIIDEFQGVQSELLELVISLFQKNMFEDLDNPKAQLILSTHDTNLMCLKNTLLNHYWFLNKEDNKSELYCAADFEDLKREDLEKEYKRNSLKAKYNSRLFEIPSKFFINDEE